MTGVIYDEMTEDWAIWIERPDGPLCEGYAATAEVAAQRLEEALIRWKRHDEEHAQQVAFAEQKAGEQERDLDVSCEEAIRSRFVLSSGRKLRAAGRQL